MNENQNKPKQKEEAPKTTLGGPSAAGSSNGWKRLLSKKWVTPAAFMAAAAIIVTLMWIYQGADSSKTTSTNEQSEAVDSATGGEATAQPDEDVPVIAGDEKMQWPVLDREKLNVELSYFDSSASKEEQEAALVQTNDTFTPHVGIDLADPQGAAFDVVAALSGKVSLVEKHPTNGNVVEIDHGNGLVTVYESVSDVSVAEGDEVKQGTVIAKAGRSDLERDLGVHLHYEVRHNGKPVNPNSLIGEQ